MPDLTVIIVSWNVKDRLRENLQNLFRATSQYPGWVDVFVVDNNSEDGTAEMVRKEFPLAYLVENDANVGFARANNQVLRQAETEYVLLLNPDMRVGETTLKRMVEWMEENRQACVAGCRLVDEEGGTIRQVRRFPRLSDQLAIVLKLPHFRPHLLDAYIRSDFDYSAAARVDSLRGGFFLINLERVRDLKLFRESTLPQLDERYFLWFEEVDYCRQVALAGGEVWYTPAAQCLDYVGQSFRQVKRGQAQRYFRDSMLKYFRRWHPFWQYLLLRAAWPLGKALALLGEKAGIRGGNKT